MRELNEIEIEAVAGGAGGFKTTTGTTGGNPTTPPGSVGVVHPDPFEGQREIGPEDNLGDL